MDLELQIIAAVLVVIFTSIVAYFVVSSNRKAGGKSRQPALKFLNKERQKAPLKSIVSLSNDTKLFRFELPQETCLGLPCGKHIRIFLPNPNSGGKAAWNGLEDKEVDDEIERKYTPTSSDADVGNFDLVVKVYRPNNKFSHGGKGSQYLDSLKVGDNLEFSGPWGLIEYKGQGVFKKGSKEITSKTIGMIAGGTGFTPMLEIIEAILADDSDQTMISLIFANQTEKDILLRERLAELEQENKGRFKVHFTLDNPPDNWTQSKGFVTKEMISQHLFPASSETVVLLCGPPPMIKFACKPNLEALGYAADRVLEF